MVYRTVNVRPETYQRLRAYRILSGTFDEVLKYLMDRVPPHVIHNLIRGPQPRVLSKPGRQAVGQRVAKSGLPRAVGKPLKIAAPPRPNLVRFEEVSSTRTAKNRKAT